MISSPVFEQTLLEFFAPVLPFLQDPHVSEILINGPTRIYVERRGQLELTAAQFPNREALHAALNNLSQYVGRPLNTECPLLEARLPDGSRVQAILPPIAADGPHVAIRRFFKDTLTMSRLVEIGALSQVAATTLERCVAAQLNILVAGGTGSGKTSFLNALSGLIPDRERVVVIEDSREINFQKAHVVQLEARPADARGRGALGIRELFRATLRMRPDRVVIGEIRGGEALDIVQAMTSGHGGCMGTLHASYPKDALTRLETMALMSDIDLPLAALRLQIGSGVQLLVQLSRLADGSRKVTHLTEVVGFDPGTQKYVLRHLFERRYRLPEARGGEPVSDLLPTHELPCLQTRLLERGVTLPESLLHVHPSRAAGE
ncbi:MAG TPA: ATPase, T2SS/T4P/T4SS family [Polyangiaceae bacterium]|nr:ATPase, T2SS/T4P/T4SS family [Polyangiaceae bacterium]